MKVVHLSLGVTPVPPGDEAAGIEGYIFQLTRYLSKLDCQVHIIDIKAGEQQRQKRRESPAVFHEVWHPALPPRSNSPFFQHLFSYLLVMTQSLLFALLSSFTLNRLIGKEKIDVIHTHNRDTALAAIVVNRMRGKPARVIYTPQCPLGLTKLSWRKKLINSAEIPALRWADHVVALTPPVKEWLVSEFNLDQAKITPIAVGTALDEVDGFLATKTACHQSNIILCTGVISDRKNQLSAVKAVPQVVAKHPEVKFIFAGPISQAQYFNSIQKFIAENNLSPWVELKGMVTKQELYDLYSDAILFFFPTTAEVQPTVLMEALAFGLPVISSTIEPIADVVSKGEGSAVLVDPYDVAGMAEAINRLLDSGSLRQSMSQRARKLAQSFSYEHIAAQTLDLYHELVKKKRNPPT